MYYVKINWFDAEDGEDRISYAFVLANDWNEAMLKVSDQFEFINSIDMEFITDETGGLIYMPDGDTAAAVIEENTW